MIMPVLQECAITSPLMLYEINHSCLVFNWKWFFMYIDSMFIALISTRNSRRDVIYQGFMCNHLRCKARYHLVWPIYSNKCRGLIRFSTGYASLFVVCSNQTKFSFSSWRKTSTTTLLKQCEETTSNLVSQHDPIVKLIQFLNNWVIFYRRGRSSHFTTCCFVKAHVFYCCQLVFIQWSHYKPDGNKAFVCSSITIMSLI